MTKADLIGEVAQKTGLTKKEVGSVIEATLDAIQGALKKGDKVTLVGFGNFSVIQRKARKGRNPKTGKEIKIPAAKVPKFSPSKALKEAVN